MKIGFLVALFALMMISGCAYQPYRLDDWQYKSIQRAMEPKPLQKWDGNSYIFYEQDLVYRVNFAKVSRLEDNIVTSWTQEGNPENFYMYDRFTYFKDNGFTWNIYLVLCAFGMSVESGIDKPGIIRWKGCSFEDFSGKRGGVTFEERLSTDLSDEESLILPNDRFHVVIMPVNNIWWNPYDQRYEVINLVKTTGALDSLDVKVAMLDGIRKSHPDLLMSKEEIEKNANLNIGRKCRLTVPISIAGKDMYYIFDLKIVDYTYKGKQPWWTEGRMRDEKEKD